jgi:hypothetical protein
MTLEGACRHVRLKFQGVCRRLGAGRSFLALAIMGLAGCDCIEVPAVDNTRPTTLLTAIWSVGGQEQRRTVDTTENTSPIVVHVPQDFRVQLFTAGSDAGGVELIGLTGRIVRPNSISFLEFPGHAFADCAKTYRAVTEFVERTPASSTIELQALSTDFHGNSSQTPTLTLIFDQ